MALRPPTHLPYPFGPATWHDVQLLPQPQLQQQFLLQQHTQLPEPWRPAVRSVGDTESEADYEYDEFGPLRLEPVLV